MYSGLKPTMPASLLSARLLMVVLHFSAPSIALPPTLTHHYHHESPLPSSFHQEHADIEDGDANISFVKETVVHMIHVTPPDQQIDLAGVYMTQQQSSSIQFLLQTSHRIFIDPLTNFLQTLFSSPPQATQDIENEASDTLAPLFNHSFFSQAPQRESNDVV
jgi:hypothetical protein